MDVKEGYRALLVTVKANDNAGGPGRPLRLAGRPNCRSARGPLRRTIRSRHGLPGRRGRRPAGEPTGRQDAPRRALVSITGSSALDYSTTRARSPGRGRTGGSRRPPGTGHRLSRDDRGQPSPARLRGQDRVRRGDQLPRRIQRQPPAPGRPLLLSGPDRGPQYGWIRSAFPGGHGLPASYPRGRSMPQLRPARASRQAPRGPDTPPLPPARATRQPPRGADLPPARATRRLPGGRGPGAGPGGGDVNRPRAASPGAAPPRPRRRRPRPTAVRRHGRTRGGARNGGPARRSRERRATVPPAGDRLAGHCGAPAPSGPRAPADAARCADSRLHPEHPTRCTRRASSRRGTRLRSAR